MEAVRSEEGGGCRDGGDEYVTGVTSFSTLGSREGSEYKSAQTLAAIEKSKEQGWTELKEEAASCSKDELLWKKLKREAPGIFVDRVEGLHLGPLIAEGGQALIHEAWIDGKKSDYVAKVFKMDGFSLANFHRQWPRRKRASCEIAGSRGSIYLSNLFFECMDGCKAIFGLANTQGELIFDPLRGSKSHSASTKGSLVFDTTKKSDMEYEYIFHAIYLCEVQTGLFLKDGRFAFLIPKYDSDLRSAINLRLKDNSDEEPPFSLEEVLHIVLSIAMGMSILHKRGVMHRDLTAANVLVGTNFPYYVVADYESATGIQGTGFWRAPEVLEDLSKEICKRNKKIWTEKVDVYSFAMTCYEVMTGRIPFNGYGKRDWQRVIDGERPRFPDYVDPQLREIVERCWHKEPSERPEFDTILESVHAIKTKEGGRSHLSGLQANLETLMRESSELFPFMASKFRDKQAQGAALTPFEVFIISSEQEITNFLKEEFPVLGNAVLCNMFV